MAGCTDVHVSDILRFFGLLRYDNRIGKDGWLFFNAGGEPIACYKGTNLFTEEQLEKIADNLVQSKNYLDERGIEFVLFIAHNKERVYAEKMPEYYGKPAENYRIQQLVDYLQENTDVCVVYPFEQMMRARETMPDTDIYYKADTHWNAIGGYIGSRELLKKLGIELPEINEVNIEVAEEYSSEGDLANMLNRNGAIDSGCEYAIMEYAENKFETEKKEFWEEYIYSSEGADARKIMIFRDSFMDSMDEYIAPQFADSYMVHHDFYSNEMIGNQKPDIFVYESVERLIWGLMDFRIE